MDGIQRWKYIWKCSWYFPLGPDTFNSKECPSAPLGAACQEEDTAVGEHSTSLFDHPLMMEAQQHSKDTPRGSGCPADNESKLQVSMHSLGLPRESRPHSSWSLPLLFFTLPHCGAFNYVRAHNQHLCGSRATGARPSQWLSSTSRQLPSLSYALREGCLHHRRLVLHQNATWLPTV